MPAGIARAGPSDTTKLESNASAGSVLRALVADDDPYMLDLVAAFLRAEGFVVEEATSGTQLLDILIDGPQPNLVVTDVQMPGMSGLAVLSLAKQRHPRVPVILMSAFATDGLRERALANGAAAVLAKPFSTLEIRELVARHVRTQ